MKLFYYDPWGVTQAVERDACCHTISFKAKGRVIIKNLQVEVSGKMWSLQLELDVINTFAINTQPWEAT